MSAISKLLQTKRQWISGTSIEGEVRRDRRTVAKVVRFTAVVREEVHRVVRRDVLRVLLDEICRIIVSPMRGERNVRGGSPFTVCHKVGMVLSNSYMVMVKPNSTNGVNCYRVYGVNLTTTDRMFCFGPA